MKLLIVRHGDPDYSIDSLTPKGWREAELLAGRLAAIGNASCYCSPLGRARDTASLTLREMSRRAGREITAETFVWLREFESHTADPRTGEARIIAWDMQPAYWTNIDGFRDSDRWCQTDYLGGTDTGEQYEMVCEGLDALLARHGYRREGRLYRAERANEDTIILFCHFGVESVMLGRLLGISPYLLWHGTIAAPTSVTTLVTEEREQGVAFFRCMSFGDVSHLVCAGEPAAFAGRFCETFDNAEQRH